MARVALVTGGTRGIGAAISKALKAAGYKVAANYGGNDAAAEKFKAETGIPVFKWDVSSFDACGEGIKKVEAEVGPVDVLVNNAGITRDGAFHKMTVEQWSAVINTNLRSVYAVTKAAIRGMVRQKWGRIINITSVVGLTGNAGQANYAASKAGLIGFTKSVAKEYGSRGILANCIAPGFIETDMTAALPEAARAALWESIPVGRLGRPADIAGAVLYLASDLGAYVTGQVLVVDGGISGKARQGSRVK